jgi:hypothetical protein
MTVRLSRSHQLRCKRRYAGIDVFHRALAGQFAKLWIARRCQNGERLQPDFGVFIRYEPPEQLPRVTRRQLSRPLQGVSSLAWRHCF